MESDYQEKFNSIGFKFYKFACFVLKFVGYSLAISVILFLLTLSSKFSQNLYFMQTLQLMLFFFFGLIFLYFGFILFLLFIYCIIYYCCNAEMIDQYKESKNNVPLVTNQTEPIIIPVELKPFTIKSDAETENNSIY